LPFTVRRRGEREERLELCRQGNGVNDRLLWKRTKEVIARPAQMTTRVLANALADDRISESHRPNPALPQRIKGQRDVAKYVAKYAAKLPEASSLVIPSYLNIEGRHWGIHRPDLIPWCVRGFDLRYTPDEIALLENAAATKIPFFNKNTRTGFSLFGPVVKKVTEEIRLRRLDKLGLSG